MSSISAGTTTGTALVSTGDTTGELDLKINGTTQAVRINTSGAIGVGTSPSYGSSGQVLTSAGSAAAPTWAAPAGFPTGTVMLFAQTSAPTGWTKNTSTGDNSALRVVTGTASTGGSVAFTTAFASQTPAGSIDTSGLSAGATTLSTTQMPSHNHTVTGAASGGVVNSGGCFTTASATTVTTSNTGGGGSHTHSVSGSATFTGTAINLAVQYIDVIRATKD